MSHEPSRSVALGTMKALRDSSYLLGSPAIAGAFERHANEVIAMFERGIQSDDPQVRRMAEAYGLNAAEELGRLLRRLMWLGGLRKWLLIDVLLLLAALPWMVPVLKIVRWLWKRFPGA